MVTMYYKMSDGNKTIHTMATANLFIFKQVLLGLVVFDTFGVTALRILLQENRNPAARNENSESV